MQGLRVSIFLDRCSACSTVHGLPACLSHPGPQCPASTTLLLTSVSASPPVMCPGPQSFHPFSVVSPFQILFSLIVMSISVARAMPTFLVPEPELKMEDNFNVKRKVSGSAIPREANPSAQTMASPAAFRNAETSAFHLVCKTHPCTYEFLLSL